MEEKQPVQEVTSPAFQSVLLGEQRSSPDPKKTKALWFIVIGVILLIILVAAGYFLISSQNKKQITENKVYRVDILSGSDSFVKIVDGFKSKMTELGYVEGKNIVYDFQKVNADQTEEQHITQKFVAGKVDLIIAFPTDAALAAKAATQGTKIPVVFANAGLEGNNLVNNIREPGGNITGVRFPGPEQTLKRFEFLLEIAPQIKKVYIVWDVNYPGISLTVDTLRKAASSTNIILVEVPVTTVKEIQADLDARSASSDIGMDAILVMPTLLTVSPKGFGVISNFAAEHKVPVAGSTALNSDQGAIFSYAPAPIEVGKLAAPIADKILKGTPAGTIPVVTADSILRINYKVAQKLGLTVPEGLLSQASEIIR
jgi:putative tryptophan/tyrosine transport system substrate-binding protein